MPAVWVAAGSNEACTTGGHSAVCRLEEGRRLRSMGRHWPTNFTAGGKREGAGAAAERGERRPQPCRAGEWGGRGERKVSHVSGPCVTHWSPPHREC